jgi:hypothetical protein
MAYSGRYTIQNTAKYNGDPTKVFFRSLWERQVFRWIDSNSDVKIWSSEEVVIPYICKTDGRIHRYFVDLKISMSNGKTYLIEIKPKSQTIPPLQPKRKTQKYITEVMTYAKNLSKWEAASQYAKSQGYEFQVWTEETLKNLGIRILTS